MRRAVLCMAVLLFGPLPLFGDDLPDHPLTLREALELVHARNPLLASGRAHALAVQANEITAALRPNPVFTSANEDFNVFNPSQFDIRRKQEFAQNVSQTIERGQKRRFRTESARWSTTLAQESYRDLERQVEFSVKATFVSMLLAKANLQLAHDNLSSFQETVRLNELRLRAGEISPTDFDRIRSEQARFEADLLSAQLALEQARTQLANFLALTGPSTALDIQGELTAPEIALTLEELLARALANRPDYLAARDAVSKADADVRLAEANGATDISLGAEYKRNGIDNTLGFTMQVPLRIFDRNQGEKLRTRRESEATRANEFAVRTAVRADVLQAYQAYQAGLARVQLYSKDYLERARRIRDRVEFSYRHGGSSLLDYLDALRLYRDTELAWRSAQAQLATAVHQLSLATAAELWP